MRPRSTVVAVLLIVVASVLLLGVRSDGAARVPKLPNPWKTRGAQTKTYVLLAWNDLGMHCISPRFSEMAILPPYNTLHAQVILRGDPPQVVTEGLTVSYYLPYNTTVANKTDFWTYAEQLFGQPLQPGIGLTGKGLAGDFTLVGDHFEAVGIPVLPLDDKMKWDPFQKAVAALKLNGKIIETAPVVMPVSDELHCDKCHADGADATTRLPAPTTPRTIETNILMLHDLDNGTNLMSRRPVLCAGCHADNALGTQGRAGVPNMSLAMHGFHADMADAPTCYDCHPGPATKCNRSAIEQMGPARRDMTQPNCERCHGTLAQMATALEAGRNPWLQEPTCEQCHGPNHRTDQPLYRNSTGHGGVKCAGCHNSPHAWWPSRLAADNRLPKIVGSKTHAIGRCSVCHTNRRIKGESPHVGFADHVD